jgi:hypothetical protein
MSFALEFYSLSWDVLKAALKERKPELARAIENKQWSRLLHDTDLGQPTHHMLFDEPNPLVSRPTSTIADGFDLIAEAMARKTSPDHDPPDVDDHAALVFAAIVRELGKPVGAIRHTASVVQDIDGELPIDFHAMFLDGVAGASFQDHALGEKLTARPMFGLFHLDFLSWGGLTQPELATLLPKYAPPSEDEKDDDEYVIVAPFAEGWLNDLVAALRAADAAKTDMVTLYLTVQEHYDSFLEELDDEAHEDLNDIGGLLPGE